MSRFVRQLGWWLRRGRKDSELAEEIEFHLEAEAEDLEETGLSAERARSRARKDLGNVARVREDTREAWGWLITERLVQDLGYSCRRLAASPGYASVALLMLGLGIGVNVAIFTLAYQVLVRPLPYERPEELVAIWGDASSRGVPKSEVAFADFAEWRAQTQAFAEIAVYTYATTQTFEGPEGAERARVQAVDRNLPGLLGVEPALGVVSRAEDAARSALVSQAFWDSRMPGTRDIGGATLRMGTGEYEIVGVMPRGFQVGEPGIEVWTPLVVDPDERGAGSLLAVGRLASGRSIGEAQAEMDAIARDQARAYPETNAGRGVRLVPLHEEFSGSVGGLYAALVVAAGAVLLVASLNVAHLVLLRGSRRRDELYVRRALGASRIRLVQQLLMETLLLACGGAVLGLVLGQWTLDLLSAFVPSGLEEFVELRAAGAMLGFATAAAILTACLAGLLPAIRLSWAGQGFGAAARASGGDGRFRRTLVAGQVGVATALLVCSALFVGTLARLTTVDPGFDPENLLTVEAAGYSGRFDELLERVGRLPGVRSATVATVRPLTAFPGRRSLTIEGYLPPGPDARPRALFRTIGPDYLETLGIPLISGRAFDDADRGGAPRVALVNESMSALYWAGRDPVGSRVKLGDPDSDNPWYTIVGVAGDVHQRSLEVEPEPELMLPYLQDDGPYGPQDMLVRTTGAGPGLADAIRRELRRIDPAVPVGIRRMEDVAASGLGDRRAPTFVISGFAALTLVLSVLGVYAMVAFAVADRAHELGIRLAVGARSGALVGMILKENLRLAAVACLAGLLIAAAVAQSLEGFLWGIDPVDPASFVIAALVVLLGALAASYLPARRVTRIEPAAVLRNE